MKASQGKTTFLEILPRQINYDCQKLLGITNFKDFNIVIT